MYEVMGSQQADRKYDSQTIQLSSVPRCKASNDKKVKSDNMDAVDPNSNMPLGVDKSSSGATTLF